MVTRILFCFLSLSLFLSSCDVVDNSPCGLARTFELHKAGSSIVSKSDSSFSTYMDGSTRVVQWSKLVDDVCSDEHVKLKFRVLLGDSTDASFVKMRGRVNWHILYEKTFEGKLDGIDYVVSGETGLKQAFPDLHGWFVPVLEVYFPTKGSYEKDIDFLLNHVAAVEIVCDYREYK